MKPHALRGTPGVEVVAELKPERGDVVVEKRRMSAFFKTDLDITLRGLKSIILEDCCAAYPPENHHACLNIYRTDLFGEYFQIMRMQEYLALVQACF
jgi:nicotinamidase-related amidase